MRAGEKENSTKSLSRLARTYKARSVVLILLSTFSASTSASTSTWQCASITNSPSFSMGARFHGDGVS